MSVPIVKFNTNDQPDFFLELRKRVNQYFKDKNISKHANFNMKFKTVFMLVLYTAPLVLMLTGVVSTLWPVMLMWVLMSMGMSGIGLSIMHDANHGSYSQNKKVNKALGYLLNYVGGYHVNWKIQHNVLHHSYTNIEGYDDDIANQIMRFSPTVKRRGIYRFQVYYAPFAYGLMSIYWFVAKDFIQLFRYNKKKLLAGQGLTIRRAFVYTIFNKAWYSVVFLVLPMLLVPIPWWQSLIGFLLMHFLCGLVLALIFQPAHVIEETNFFVPDESSSVENNWAIHQMKTTANFARESRLFSWFVGGLNYQIEHHLFPNICHVHYRSISSIVKETAREFNVPYYEHRTFYAALKSHFSLIHQFGTGEYDRRLAKA